MNILEIDTSHGTIDLVAVANNKIAYKISKRGRTWPFRIEAHLPLEVSKAVKKLGATPDIVAVNTGPGSYTSLRSGIAFVKGWYLGLKAAKHKQFCLLPMAALSVNDIATKRVNSYTVTGCKATGLNKLKPIYTSSNENSYKKKPKTPTSPSCR